MEAKTRFLLVKKKLRQADSMIKDINTVDEINENFALEKLSCLTDGNVKTILKNHFV
jgi:hypothetical protein